MRIRNITLALLTACGSSATPSTSNPDAQSADSAPIDAPGLHDQLTSCPDWTSASLHPAYCERACEPKPGNTAAGCMGATNQTAGDVQRCTSTVNVDGTFGCCVMVGNPYRVLFYVCP